MKPIMLGSTVIEYQFHGFVVQQCTTSHNIIISKIDKEAPNALKHIVLIEHNQEITREEAEKLLEGFFAESTTI